MWKMASDDWKTIAIRQNFIDTMYCSKNLMLWKSVYFIHSWVINCLFSIPVKKLFDNGEILQRGPQAKWKFTHLKEPTQK